MKKISEATNRVIAARTALLLDQPFWGTLSLRLVLREDPHCPTAWTDGYALGYNPDFVKKQTNAQLIGLIAHEVEHCARGHCWRRDGREPRRWNEAADRTINPDLREVGYKLPEGALYELAQEHVGKSAEWIYARLPEYPARGQKDGSKGTGAGAQGDDGAGGEGDGDGEDGQAHGGWQASNPLGEVRDAPTADPQGNAAPTEADWKQAVIQVASAVRSQGKLPAGLERLVKEATRSKTDYRSIMSRFVTEVARNDYSWRRPNRRYIPRMYLPSLYSEECGPIAVGVDTSGSVDDVMLGQYQAAVRTIVEDVKPRRVLVLYCDAHVGHMETFERDEPVVFRARGGGGTDFRPVFKMIEEQEEQPVCILYFTDLYGDFPAEAPETPTLWVTTEERHPEVPFGDVVVNED